MVVDGVLLLHAYWRYDGRIIHHNPRFALMLMMLIVVLALHYERFIAAYPNETYHHLRLLNSYWTQNLSPVEKIGHLAQEYLNGLNPLYWYVPNNPIDLIRHQMKGYGNILWITLPFALIGLIVCLKQLRSAPHRKVLIALATSPLGGVLDAANVQRDLVFVIPAAILTALGLASVLQPLVTRTAYAPAAIGLCGVLCLGNFMLLADALINGPTWYDNYGLYGMQYGARQVFQTIADLRRQSPETNVWVAADWLNGPDALLQFFLPDDPHVQLFDTNDFLQARYDIDGVLFVLPSEDYQRVVNSHKFMIDDVQQTLDLPNQTTGFYFLHLEYSPQADALFAAEFEARRQLVTEPATLDGQPVIVRHTSFDFGNVANLFDGETFTLARTAGVNPAVIEIDFPTPRRLTGLTLTTGSMDIDLQVELFDAGDTPSYTYTQRYTGLPPDPTVDLNFEPHPGAVSKVRLEIRSPAAEETAHIHIREIRLR